jgi:hypothetical protein
VKVISWNIARREDAWRQLLDCDADVALLQEAAEPPADVASRVEVDGEPWLTAGAGVKRPWRTAVVGLGNRVRLEWLRPRPIEVAVPGELAVSRLGTLAAAHVEAPDGSRLTLASVYGVWESPHPATASDWIYADGSVHRVISDLAALIGQAQKHRILVAGDLNILHGYGEGGNGYWAARYGSVFTRMHALGLPLVGPQAPNGRPAEPWPDELPKDSANVPTYHTNTMTPAQAQRQMDFVFASVALAGRVSVRALNWPEEWGPSDHCRVQIELS